MLALQIAVLGVEEHPLLVHSVRATKSTAQFEMSRNKPPKELELDGDEAAFLADMLAASCEIPQPDNTLPAAHAIGSVHQQAVITKPPPDVQQRLEPVQEASNELSGMSRSSPRLLMAAVYGGVLPPKQHDHEAPACHPPPRNLFTVDGDIPADAQLDRQVRLSTSLHQQQAPRSPLRPMSPARSQQSHAAVQAAPTLTAEEVQAMLQPLLRLEQVLADELASPKCGNARVLALASRLCSSYNSVSVKLLGGGALNQALEQLEKARVLLDQGSLLQDTFNYKELKAVTLNNLGCWYQYADMPDVALSHLQVGSPCLPLGDRTSRLGISDFHAACSCPVLQLCHTLTAPMHWKGHTPHELWHRSYLCMSLS